jgi:hypothetical protein
MNAAIVHAWSERNKNFGTNCPLTVFNVYAGEAIAFLRPEFTVGPYQYTGDYHAPLVDLMPEEGALDARLVRCLELMLSYLSATFDADQILNDIDCKRLGQRSLIQPEFTRLFMMVAISISDVPDVSNWTIAANIIVQKTYRCSICVTHDVEAHELHGSVRNVHSLDTFISTRVGVPIRLQKDQLCIQIITKHFLQVLQTILCA